MPHFDDKVQKMFGGVDDPMAKQLAAKLPGSGAKTLVLGYTSEREIRECIMELLERPTGLSKQKTALAGIDDEAMQSLPGNKPLSREQRLVIAEKWIEKLILTKRKGNRLMSDTQLADWRIGRKLGMGDKARYIGPDRNETTQALLIVPRLHGQTGTIIRTSQAHEGRLLTFHPDEPVAPIEAPGVDRQLVDLQVKEYTPGWLHLERIP